MRIQIKEPCIKGGVPRQKVITNKCENIKKKQEKLYFIYDFLCDSFNKKNIIK